MEICEIFNHCLPLPYGDNGKLRLPDTNEIFYLKVKYPHLA